MRYAVTKEDPPNMEPTEEPALSTPVAGPTSTPNDEEGTGANTATENLLCDEELAGANTATEDLLQLNDPEPATPITNANVADPVFDEAGTTVVAQEMLILNDDTLEKFTAADEESTGTHESGPTLEQFTSTNNPIDDDDVEPDAGTIESNVNIGTDDLPEEPSVRIIITGTSGYLGQHLLTSLCLDVASYTTPAQLNEGGIEIYAAFGTLTSFNDAIIEDVDHRVHVTKMSDVDISDVESMESLIHSVDPTAIIHLAAISAPLKCENDPPLAMAVNCPLALLNVVPAHCDLLFLSSDQVYDGSHPPYSESSLALPLNVYGKSKLAFEEQLCGSESQFRDRAVCLRSSLIVGPSTPFACRKQTFLQFIHDSMQANIAHDYYIDECRSIVYVGDVIRTISHFLKHGTRVNPGIYNLGGPESLSRCDLALGVAEHCGFDVHLAIEAEKAGLPPGPVPNPLDISMVSSKLFNVTGIPMTGLEKILEVTFPLVMTNKDAKLI